MGNGLTRLETRFLGEPDSVDARAAQSADRAGCGGGGALGLVTPTIDEIDWDDEVRLMLEERASFSPDALTAMEANLRFAGPETMETRIFGRLTAWQNWIFQRPNAVGEHGALKRYGSGVRPSFDRQRRDRTLTRSLATTCRRERRTRRRTMPDGAVDYSGLIPNNVGLNADARVRKALETWHPGYIDWWKEMGPEGFQSRWSICAPRSAWIRRAGRSSAMCGCRNTNGASCWRPRSRAARIPFGAHKGEPAWQEVPGEYRAMLRRLLVIQGDTEPASVEQQRHLGATAPSLYDLRNLFQVNVEEGRHLWAMVYLLQKYFGT